MAVWTSFFAKHFYPPKYAFLLTSVHVTFFLGNHLKSHLLVRKRERVGDSVINLVSVAETNLKVFLPVDNIIIDIELPITTYYIHVHIRVNMSNCRSWSP